MARTRAEIQADIETAKTNKNPSDEEKYELELSQFRDEVPPPPPLVSNRTNTGDGSRNKVSAIDLVKMPSTSVGALVANWNIKKVTIKTPAPGMPWDDNVGQVIDHFFAMLAQHPTIIARGKQAAVGDNTGHIWVQVVLHVGRINTVKTAVYQDAIDLMLLQVDPNDVREEDFVPITNNWLRGTLTAKIRSGYDNPLRVFMRSQGQLLVDAAASLGMETAGATNHGLPQQFKHLGADFIKGVKLTDDDQCAVLQGNRQAFARKRGDSTTSGTIHNVLELSRNASLFG